jgi:hypothetical protein
MNGAKPIQAEPAGMLHGLANGCLVGRMFNDEFHRQHGIWAPPSV